MRSLIVLALVSCLGTCLLGLWAYQCGYRAGLEAGAIEGRLEANREYGRFLDALEEKLKGAK